jgi:hypothetical protein
MLLAFAVCLLVAMPLAVSAQDALPIEIGQSVDGELSDDVAEVQYVFTADEGTTIVATQVSSDFDSYLILLDAEGDEIAFNDDGAGNLNSRIGPFTLPDDGEYTLVSTSYAYRTRDETVDGEFTLTLEVFEADLVEYGETVQGEVDGDSQVLFQFSAETGDRIAIRATSDDFAPYVQLSDPDGYNVFSSGGDEVAAIGPYEIYADGTYTIALSDYYGSGALEGEYTLSINEVDAVLVELPATETVTFDAQTPFVYLSFEGERGDLISVYVDADIDTTLIITDPYGYQLAMDEDSGPSFNPELEEVQLYDRGEYTVALSVASSETDGTGEITIQRAELASLNEGAQEIGFGSDRQTNSLRYTAPERGLYTFTITFDDEGFSPSVDIVQDGESLAYVSTSYVQSLTFTFEIPDDGDVSIIINEYSYDNVDAVVEISSAE